MKYLIWDFNGTIIDDVDVCIASENETIKKYLPERPLLSKEDYLNVFMFPVKEYYRKVGFDFSKNSYEEIGDYWFAQYQAREKDITVFPGVEDLMKRAHEKGIRNVVLSASRCDQLEKQLKQFDLFKYMDEIIGANDIYAYSKTENGLKFMEGKNPDDCLYLGDTAHDLDTAKAMGVKCILVAKGHAFKEDLMKIHDCVVDDIREIEI